MSKGIVTSGEDGEGADDQPDCVVVVAARMDAAAGICCCHRRRRYGSGRARGGVGGLIRTPAGGDLTVVRIGDFVDVVTWGILVAPAAMWFWKGWQRWGWPDGAPAGENFAELRIGGVVIWGFLVLPAGRERRLLVAVVVNGVVLTRLAALGAA
ncbi:zinc finger C-x8-C-x5-C-x3-H type family protein [Striga asiatica]|uniref:Zinc finger C-x8-C-x5-C-x3-H type family protein n=1 Tax=Striga asiatica TaxID=4170 RepID=A0A5A7Q8G0_STRAF|nr:zinc finger C-x8-C-x5-C-x3-H type family protein [Striga asiatica]